MKEDKIIDLSNCDQEPIHIPGSIQPHGYLIGVSVDWEILYWSNNLEILVGKKLATYDFFSAADLIDPNALHTIKNKVQKLSFKESVVHAKNVSLFNDERTFDLSVHKSANIIIIEFQASTEEIEFEILNLSSLLSDRLSSFTTTSDILKNVSKHVFALSGFDRVMVYKFDQDGSGEVIFETAKSGIGSFLGLHFPSSDIPSKALRLYATNLIRIISDLDYNSIDISCSDSISGQPLDLSYSYLRSVSPIQVEYLKNMGVRASLSISIMVNRKLWGLIACHHYSTKYLSLIERFALANYGKLFSHALESSIQKESDNQKELVKNLQNEIISSISETNSTINLELLKDSFRKIITCDGVSVVLDGVIQTDGDYPGVETINKILDFLNKTKIDKVFYTKNLREIYPESKTWEENVCGILAIPGSENHREFVLFFRKEAISKVYWAGNPEKNTEFDPNGARLTPRKSFESWLEEVKDHSSPWTESEIEIAEHLRNTLVEVLLRIKNASSEERKKLIARQELLIAELNHRVRNILALIKGVVNQAAGETSESEVILNILGRIESLARAHDQITRQNWGAGSLKEVIFEEVKAYLKDGLDRFQIEGPDCLFVPEAISTLALVIHELTTNSVKHGALCSGKGYVKLEIIPEDDSVDIVWQDFDGPEVKKPDKRGFGSTIIERSIPHDLKGKAETYFDPLGYTAKFSIPKIFVQDVLNVDFSTNNQNHKPKVSMSDEIIIDKKRVLLVEDNLLIALDAQQILEELGALEVYTSSSVSKALDIIKNSVIDLAVLDMNLGNENSLPIADELKRLNIPFVFASGYDSKDMLNSNHFSIPIIRKPYSKTDFAKGINLLNLGF